MAHLILPGFGNPGYVQFARIWKSGLRSKLKINKRIAPERPKKRNQP